MRNTRRFTRNVLIAAWFTVTFFLGACGKVEQKPYQPNRAEGLTGKSLARTIDEHRDRLLSIPGVLKVEPGDCSSDSCIKVYVAQKTPILINQIPPMLETWQVEIVETTN